MKYREIKKVHLEMTTRCNAFCPMCARNIQGDKINPFLPMAELSISDIKKIFLPPFIKQLDNIYACGNYGEPALAKDTLKVYQYFREISNDLWLDLISNGSVQTPDWWEKLAKIINEKGTVIFSIDGLKDTNHIYRRGTDWEKIIANIKAFIKAGGKARWEYLVFKHNEHQIEKAEKLSKEMGFVDFQIKKTGRFYRFSNSEGAEKQVVKNKNGQIDYYIEKPEAKKYQNKSLLDQEKIIQEFGSMDNYFLHAKIDCKYQTGKKIYISAEGLVFPCCWMGVQLYPWYFPEKSTEVWSLIESLGGLKTVSAKKRSIKEIVEGPLFAFAEKSWVNKKYRKKLSLCAKICGIEFDRHKAVYS